MRPDYLVLSLFLSSPTNLSLSPSLSDFSPFSTAEKQIYVLTAHTHFSLQTPHTLLLSWPGWMVIDWAEMKQLDTEGLKKKKKERKGKALFFHSSITSFFSAVSLSMQLPD